MLKVLGNAVAMLAARLAPPVFSFAINVAIARVYGADVLGAYVWLLSLLMVFQAVATAGMSLLVTREIAAEPERGNELVRQARTVGVASGALATVGFVACAVVPSGAPDPRAALALALSFVPSAWIAAQEAYFVARHQHHAVTVVAIAENAVKLALAGAAMLAGFGLVGVCAAIAVARLAALAVGERMLATRGCTGAWRLDFREAAPLARTLPPFAAMLVLAMLFFRVDVLVLGWLRGEQATGIYGAALTLYTVALLVPDSAMSAVYPRLAASFHDGADGVAQATLVTAKILALALVPVAVGLGVLAGPILHVIYGDRFAGSAPALRLLAASLPVHAVNAALGQALQAGGHQRAMLGVAFAGTALHLAVSSTLIALLGIPGAPLGVLIAALAAAAMSLVVFHRRVAPIRIGVHTVIAASAVVGPVALAVLAPAGFEIAAIAAGGLWLGVALLGRQVFGRAELAEMARVLKLGRAEAGA